MPCQEEIAMLAYDLFQRGGARHGHDLDHWFTAERELVDASLGNSK